MLAGLGCLTTFSCKKEAEAVLPHADVTPYTVTLAQATTVAENIALSAGVVAQRQHNQTTGDTQSVFRGKQRLLTITAVAAAAGKPALYLCNYARGGFAIVAADRHMQPVLAFAERGALPTTDLRNRKVVADGLITWLENTKLIAAALRQNPSKENTAAGATDSWSAMEAPICPDYGDGTTCDDQPTYTSTQVGPLMQTTWGQGCGYNDYVTGSNESGYCYHCPTGCVATAQAQVMYYWHYPASFDWASMAVDHGTPAAAHLMDDLGGKLHMDYNPANSSKGGSGADPDYIDDALKGNYGYRSAEYNSSQDPGLYQTVISNLNNRMPVILGGFSAANWFGYPAYDSEGHCWVCDGYIESYSQGNGYLQYHMNWGWEGYGNGWFAYDNWQVRDSGGKLDNFNYAKTYTLNIHP